MNMHEISQAGSLELQDRMNYFGWPPPKVPIDMKYRQPLKKIIRLYFVFFLPALFIVTICSVVSYTVFHIVSGDYSFAQVFGYIFLMGTLLMLVCVLLILVPPMYRIIEKLRASLRPPLPVPSDQEYENWVRSWQSSIRQYGMQRLGLSPDEVLSRPLYVRSLVWPHFHDTRYYRSYNSPILIKYGADGRPHASINRYTFFYPTQHYIAVYTADVNALDKITFEGTRTYFYEDIVGVETSAININDGYLSYAMQHFELRVSSGQSIGATTYVRDLDVDQTVRALRTLLRDKKYGIQGGGYGSINF